MRGVTRRPAKGDLTTSAATTSIPRYIAGTWDIDPAHSEVSFTVRHMMVGKERGRVGSFSGQIVTGEDLAGSSATAAIDATSIDTGVEQRDEHIRSAAFFDVENHPRWTLRSTSVHADGEGLTVDGELTIKGATRPVSLAVEVNGFGPDSFGGIRAGFSASATIRPQ